MIETAIKCDPCGRILEDDFDECCEKEYTEVYRCRNCGDWVEELARGEDECSWCVFNRPEPMTYGQFYGYRRL